MIAPFLKKFAPPAIALCLGLLFSLPAAADPIGTGGGKLPGCDDRIMKAMNDKANARVDYDVAETENVIDKPDSILALTCFNNAAGEGALQLGSMFSGDFTTQLNNIIPDSLTAFYDDFKDAPGNDTGVVDYTQTALGTNIGSCTYMDDLWTQIKTEGLQKNMPYPLASDYVTGQQPAGGDTVASPSKFDDNWQKASSDNDFGNVSSDIGLLPKATTATTLLSSPVNTDDECQVLTKIGMGGSVCP
jgi:hypothetical protein